MIRGCQRKIIFVKDTKSSLFDEAYFVLKSDVEKRSGVTEADMITEAARIVDENLLSVYCSAERSHRRRMQWKARMFSFSLGALSCGVLLLVVMAIIRL